MPSMACSGLKTQRTILFQVKYTNQNVSSHEPGDDAGKYTFDTVPDQEGTNQEDEPIPSLWMGALLFLDQIKREKGVWWMPWQQEAMKDVIPCVKPWGAGNRL